MVGCSHDEGGELLTSAPITRFGSVLTAFLIVDMTAFFWSVSQHVSHL